MGVRRSILTAPLFLVLLCLVFAPAASARGLKADRGGADGGLGALRNALHAGGSASALPEFAIDGDIQPSASADALAPQVTGDGATAESGPYSFTLKPFRSARYKIIFANSGTTTWTTAAGYALTIHETGQIFALGACDGLAPGSACTWRIKTRAGTQKGTFTYHFNMEHSGAPFGDTIAVTITVD